MTLVDSHCHVHDPEYNFDISEVLKRASENDIKKIICIGTSLKDSEAALSLAEKYPETVSAAIGFHPSELDRVNAYMEDFLNLIKSRSPQSRRGLSDEPRNGGSEERSRFNEFEKSCNELVAIGEIGLDYHYKPYDRKRQIELFETMLDLAIKNNLPVIFHVREAFDDFFAVLKNFPNLKKAVVHSFSDDEPTLKKILETTDFYIGTNGLATFAKIPLPPIERMLLETDAPFLTPVPFRGKINEPAYIRSIASFVAEKSSLSIDEVARITTNNVKNLFGI
jgi:TatD DNase family protein